MTAACLRPFIILPSPFLTFPILSTFFLASPFHNIFFLLAYKSSKIPRFLNFPKRRPSSSSAAAMAVNTSNKKAIADIILPQVEFKVTTTGVTITSERLNTPRFLPFNQSGQCRSCKSTDLELDHVITKEGVTLFSNRIKGAKFVPFDSTHEFPDHCFFRLKSRGHVFNIPHSAMLAPDEPIVLQENGAIKRGGSADQIPIDKFVKAKRVKQELPDNEPAPTTSAADTATDPDIEFLFEGIGDNAADADNKENEKPPAVAEEKEKEEESGSSDDDVSEK